MRYELATQNENSFNLRNNDVASFYDTGGSIGKRYRRQDEAGTPFGLTIDHDTLEDNTITLRDRDTMKQERVSLDAIITKMKDLLQMLKTMTKKIKTYVIAVY